MNIVILHCRNTWEFSAELHATLRYCALLYPTVARWVQVFEGVQHCTLLSTLCMSVSIIEKCLGEDRHWTVKELAKHTGIYGFTVPYFLQQGIKGSFVSRYDVHQWTPCENCHVNLEQLCHKANGTVNQVTVTVKHKQGAVGQNSNSSLQNRIIHIHHKTTRWDKICCPQN
jgi:hypothetical protein